MPRPRFQSPPPKFVSRPASSSENDGNAAQTIPKTAFEPQARQSKELQIEILEVKIDIYDQMLEQSKRKGAEKNEKSSKEAFLKLFNQIVEGETKKRVAVNNTPIAEANEKVELVKEASKQQIAAEDRLISLAQIHEEYWGGLAWDTLLKLEQEYKSLEKEEDVDKLEEYCPSQKIFQAASEVVSGYITRNKEKKASLESIISKRVDAGARETDLKGFRAEVVRIQKRIEVFESIIQTLRGAAKMQSPFADFCRQQAQDAVLRQKEAEERIKEARVRLANAKFEAKAKIFEAKEHMAEQKQIAKALAEFRLEVSELRPTLTQDQMDKEMEKKVKKWVADCDTVQQELDVLSEARRKKALEKRTKSVRIISRDPSPKRAADYDQEEE